MNRLPGDSWQKAWQLALGLTVEALQKADLQERCAKSGAAWRPDEGAVDLVFLNRTYRIRPPEFDVVRPGDEAEVPIAEKILILHYLQTADGIAPSGEWITFAQVPGGDLYLRVFRARSIDRLVRAFSGREEALVEAAQPVGGCEADYGDVSVEVRAFPNVPVLLTLWRGDEEFPASGNLLFDATVVKYLPMEDMVVLAGMIAGRLCGR